MLADIIVHGAGSGAPPVHAALALLLPKIQLPFWTPPPDVEHGHGHGHSYTPPPAGPADLSDWIPPLIHCIYICSSQCNTVRAQSGDITG